MPSNDPDQRKSEPPLTGDPPNPINPPAGCRFHTRCAFAEGVCSKVEPGLAGLGHAAGHVAACHMAIPGSGHSQARSGLA
jgi:peptide/nickel transport system ATP-binding protein